MTAPPTRPAPRPFGAPGAVPRLGLLTAAALACFSCTQPPAEVVVMATDTVEVAARPSPLGDRSVLEWKVRHGGHDWTIRTHLPELRTLPSLDSPEARALLSHHHAWTPPYLFLREQNPNQEASRASVDHVFHCSQGAVIRLGTLAAGASPGSQFAQGRFQDVYDRLEFSPLAAPHRGPTFPILLKESRGRFQVDSEATWNLSKPSYENHWNRLLAYQKTSPQTEPIPDSPAAPPPAGLRSARVDALFCLALARYCDRPQEYQAALDAARPLFDPIADLLEEIGTITPAELAASRDEVLRSNPALVNLFKESSDLPPEPETPLPTPAPAPEGPRLPD